MDYNDLISGMKRFGACDEDVCINSLGIASNMIHVARVHKRDHKDIDLFSYFENRNIEFSA